MTTKHLLLIISVAILCLTSAFIASSLQLPHSSKGEALGGRLLRWKRQSTAEQQANANQGASSATASSTGDGSANSQDQDGKPVEEVLPGLKCDFGTSDVPDLCKFKVVEMQNPLIKGQTNWSHGSGKLALYQGGPLIDASDRNDTAGGYIFYETSNPYVANMTSAMAAVVNPATTMSGYSVHLYDALMRSHNNHRDYSTVEKGAYMRGSSSQPMDNFQQISSGRVAIANNLPSAAFISPNLTAPGPSGMCLSFQYAIQGLSADEMRIYVNDHKTERSRQIWASSESAGQNWTKGEVLYSVTNVHSVMFTASSSSTGYNKDMQQQRKFRGYIAVDEVEINKHDPAGSEGACKGHCNFDGDLCGWTNAENGQEDDFDWSFGRGSDNLFTGPARDFVSSANNELTGSYLFTDSGYPRRPGDRATLISPMFQPTPFNDAMCMRLAVHMFGSGVGSLVIKIRYADESAAPAPVASGSPQQQQPPPPAVAASQPATRTDGKNDLVIWEMTGDAGNHWHHAQTSVSSSKSPFQVLIEGVVGENQLGDIAIDEISFSSGPCPTSPPVASKNYGDCTFEQSMCYWRNPDSEIHLDDLDWIRSADEQSIHGPNFDHTLKKKSGSYIKLENTFREPKSGTRAFLLSPIFQPKASGSVQCLSFYYYMFMRSISSSGPNLGTIRVYLASNNELVPIWRLTNPISSPIWKHGRASLSSQMLEGQPAAPTKLFQIAFEGIWGDAQGGAIALDDITVFDGACDIMPNEARSVPGECTFDVDMCSWLNKTSELATIGMIPINNGADTSDQSRSPFLQSVNSAAGHSSARLNVASSMAASKKMGWQLATVDSRPVNLQDHTYKAPIGYVYVDVLDSSSQQIKFPLQANEIQVQAGQQITQCLSFWFAAYGRQELNQLHVYLTQSSAPPLPPEDSGGSQPPPRNNQQPNNPTNVSPAGGGATATNPTAAASESDQENAMAWKAVDGKLLWSMGLRNITEVNRRKWQYGQVTVKADSNYIVRFVALSSDGGFALDDISYYDGPCETRPALAKVLTDDEAGGESGGGGGTGGTGGTGNQSANQTKPPS